MRVARAFASLLRAAWHDPLWALMAVVRMPFLAFWPLVGGAVSVLLVGFAGVGLASWLTPPDSLWNQGANAGVLLVMAALAWRLLTAPLLVRFGDLEEDAHGSGRFAPRKELRDLLGAQGMLIGRDEKGRRRRSSLQGGHLSMNEIAEILA